MLLWIGRVFIAAIVLLIVFGYLHTFIKIAADSPVAAAVIIILAIAFYNEIKGRT